MRTIALVSLLSAAVLGYVNERCHDGQLRQWMVEHCVALTPAWWDWRVCKTWKVEQAVQACVQGKWREKP
jgi:hypothetical protein